MPDAPRTEQLSRTEKIMEAVGWFVAVLWSNVRNARTTVVRVCKFSSRLDLTVLAIQLVLLAAVGTLALVSSYRWEWVLVAVLQLAWTIAELSRLNHGIRESWRVERLLAQKPAGAPRVAVVRCTHGDWFRFAYGPAGWQYMGPATRAEIVSKAAG